MPLVLAAACVSSGPTGGTESTPRPQPFPETPAPHVRSWIFTRDSSAQAYVSSTQVVLQTGGLTDTSHVRARYDLAWKPRASGARVTGIIREMVFEAGSRTGGQPRTLTAGDTPFSGESHGAAPRIDSLGGRPLDTGGCVGSPGNAAAYLSRQAFYPPQDLRLGQTWTDTGTVLTCHDLVPVSLTAVRTYSVEGEVRTPGKTVLVITRTEQSTGAGEGSSGQHRVAITSQGSGSARFLLAPATGLLDSSSIEHRSTISITTSGRTQVFSQAIRETVNRTLER
jgi:hypothetical protein